MKRGIRAASYIVIGALGGLLLALLAIQLLTRTDWGKERARQFALGWLADRVQGTVSVGRIGGRGLLRGVMVHDVSIVDRRGRPFLELDSARATYDWRTLLSGQIVLNSVVLFQPQVFLEQLPGDTAWNYQYIFMDTTTRDPAEPQHRTLVMFRQARIIGGEATVLTPAAADGVIEPEDTARAIIEQLPSGWAKFMRFRNIDAQLGRVLWESPADTGRYFEVRRASGTGFVFRDPLTLRHAQGRLALRDSVVSLDFSRVELPASRAALFGTVVQARGQNYYDLQIDADRFAFEDLQWVSPRLPEQGGGSARLRIQSQRASHSTLWFAEDARIQTGGSTLAGTLGVVLGDTTYFTRVDLRASPLDVALLERLLPGGVPVEGVLVGTVQIKGPLSALETTGDLRLSSTNGGVRAGASMVNWSGVLDVRRGRLGARQLRADVRSFDLALLTAWHPELKLAGVVTGQVNASGRLAAELRVDADLHHLQGVSDSSWFTGQGTIGGSASARTLDMALEAKPLALSELALRYPALVGLAGHARGPIHLRGPLDQLDYDAELTTDAGPIRLRGQLSRGLAGPRYTGTADLSAFRPAGLLARLPAASLNGTVAFDLTGAGLAGMRGDVQVLLDSAHLGRLPLQRGLLEARVADGLLFVDSLHAVTLAGDFTARGSIGLVPERTGSMSMDLRSSAVGLLEADIFGAAASTKPETPRLAGSLRAHGELTGNVQHLQVQAEGDARQLVLGPLRLARATARFSGEALGSDSTLLQLEASADSAAVWGQLLEDASFTLGHAAATSSFRLTGRGPDGGPDRLQLEGWLRRRADTTQAALTRLSLGQTARWELADTVNVRLQHGSLAVSPLELRSADGDGALRAQGVLGWSSVAGRASPLDFQAQLTAVPFADVLRTMRSPAPGGGLLDGSMRITGTTLDPLLAAHLTGTRIAYQEMRLERGFLELNFAEQGAELFLEAQQGDKRVLTGSGHVPLDLRFTDVRERRLDRPLDLNLSADSLPAAQVLPLLNGFSNVQGWLDGSVRAAGTTLDPALSGELRAEHVAATWNATGVRYTDLDGRFRLVSDRVVEVDARARTHDPRRAAAGGAGGIGIVTGKLDFARLSDPFFDLNFRADGVLAAQRRDVQAVVSGNVHLGGRYTAPVVDTASLRVDRGTMYLDEVYRQFFVVQLDSASMFQFVDTSLVATRRVLPVSRNPFLENLSIRRAQVSVGNGSWLRSQDLDVEVEGDLNVAFDRRADDLRISGSLNVVRGTYQLVYPPLQARRFRVSEGSIEFPGLPGIDPNLMIAAIYKGRAQEEPLDIIAQVTGTLQTPRVRLTSNEEPPISESDLASYLFFGVPTWAMGDLVGGQAADTRETLTGLGRTFAPSLLGYASSGLQVLAQGAGLLDYVSLTTADVTSGTEGARAQNLFSGAQLELGRYFTPSVYVGLSQRLANASSEPALRLEWRFHPTFTLEVFSEERFSRNAPGFGYNQEVLPRRVYGFFLFREWGY